MKSDLNITFYKEEKFKETPIGKIPEDWGICKLGSVLKLKNGERPKISEKGEISIYGANGVMGHTADFLVDNDFTIIIGRVGASGEIHIAQGKIWVSDNAIYSESYKKEEIHLPFMYYLLKLKNLSHFATKTTHPIITQTFLNSFPIQLPSLPEQKAIAHVLSTIDEAIQKTNEIIEKTERLKKGLMQELLTKGIGHKEFKDTEIGRIPKEWEIVKLKDQINIETGKRVKGGALDKGNVASIGGEHIDDQGNIQWGNMKFIPEDFYNSLKHGKVKLRDILLVKDGATTGKVAILKNLLYEKAAVNEHVFIIRSKVDKVINEFLFYFLFSKFGQIQIRTRFHGMIGGITRKDIETILIPLPALSEQKRIASILSTVDRKLEIERKRKEKLERIKKALMDLLLTGKIRVRT